MCKVELFLFLQLQYIGLVMSRPIRMRPMLKLSHINQNMNNKYYERNQIRLTYTPYKSGELDIEKKQECGPSNIADVSCQRVVTFKTKLPKGIILRNKKGFTTPRFLRMSGASKKNSMKEDKPSANKNSQHIAKGKKQNNQSPKAKEPVIIDYTDENPLISRIVNYTTPSKQVDDTSKDQTSEEKEDIEESHHNKDETNTSKHHHSKEKNNTSKQHESTGTKKSSKRKSEEENSKETSADPSITSSTSAPYVDGTSTPSLHDHATRCNNLAKCEVKNWPTF